MGNHFSDVDNQSIITFCKKQPSLEFQDANLRVRKHKDAKNFKTADTKITRALNNGLSGQ